jgi:hypothetical protein
MTIEIKGIGFDRVGDAMQHWYASGAESVMSIGGTYVVTSKAEAERVAAMGVAFAYVFDHPMPDGTYRTVTVPVNDD